MKTDARTTTALEQGRRLIDEHEVAARLGVSARTVRRLAARGELPPKLAVGSTTSRRWDAREIDSYIQNGCKLKGKRRR
jgi:excisionase family DNA binding protein